MEFAGTDQEGMPEYRHTLQCTVKRISSQFMDKKPDGSPEQRNIESYILIPRLDTTQATLFLNEYLEHLNYREDIEFVALLPYPVACEARLSFRRPNKDCEQVHFLVMTMKISDDNDVLVKDVYKDLFHLQGREIEIKTFTDTEEENFNI